MTREMGKISEFKTYVVTGTFHGAFIYATTEGEARRIFHNYYNGESIVTIKIKKNYIGSIRIQ